MLGETATILIDCENLTGPRRLETAGRWLGAGRFELFGRRAAMAPWREELQRRGWPVAAEHPVPDDAPSQAADRAVARRVDELVRAAAAGPLVIASNDLGFAADVERARQAGVEARQDSDPDESGLLRLVVAETAGPDGWAGAGGVGDHLARRFGMPVRGRLDVLAERAGLKLRRDRNGLWLAVPGGTS
jgi:hypothetical protein